MGRSPRGSVLLIQGCDNPDGWRQVRRLREDAGVHVQTPELPSHVSRIRARTSSVNRSTR
jgi:hypothetical protein